MTDPISSSKWTGPPPDHRRQPRRFVFTHWVGGHGFASDYARILQARREADAIAPEVRAIIRLAAVVLLVSPVALWIAWMLLHASSRDLLIEDNAHVLVACGLTAITLAASQIMWRSPRLIWLRKAMLWGALAATLVVAAGYVYVGIEAHSSATASAPERTYELAKDCGRRCVTIVHQRADGTTLEGADMGPPVDYARACALVQRIDGEHGFRWVRVLDRSRVPRSGQLWWPIRREECFSDTPLSELPR